jgi:hypothetical protein
MLKIWPNLDVFDKYPGKKEWFIKIGIEIDFDSDSDLDGAMCPNLPVIWAQVLNSPAPHVKSR